MLSEIERFVNWVRRRSPDWFKTECGYNSAGLMSSMSYPSDNLGGAVNGVTFSYLPQLTLGTVAGGAESYVQANRYDNAGRVVERKLGNMSGSVSLVQEI